MWNQHQRQGHGTRGLCTFACVVVLGLTACGRFGAATITGGRERYHEAIRSTGDEQMLLNLVRLQYDDLPFFLQVTSVLSTLSASVNVGLSGTVSANSQLGLQLGGAWSESPTVTYQPLQGEDYVNTLVRRLDEQSLVTLPRGGWNVYEVFRILVHDFGVLRNVPPQAPFGTEPPREEERALPKVERERKQAQRDHERLARERELAQKFDAALRILFDLVARGAVELDLDPTPPHVIAAMRGLSAPGKGPSNGADDKVPIERRHHDNWPVLRITNPTSMSPEDRRQWCELLHAVHACSGADTESKGPCDGEIAPSDPRSCIENGPYTVYFLSPSHLRDERYDRIDHIVITMRTLLEVMSSLAGGISVPEGEAHGRPTAKCDDSAHESLYGEQPIFRVYCSKHAPREAAVRVWYRGNWYYVRSGDASSRRAFSILRLLFQEQLGKSIVPLGPTLTVPTGR